jgi:predicted acylesterase/phospholipase RssA
MPFKRIALLLTGGGAFGAYEVGVLRALHALGIRPSIVAGTSVGALNGLAWVAHDGDPAALERVWRELRPSDVGIRWGLLGFRAMGGFLLGWGLLEALLVLAGSPETAVLQRAARLQQLVGFLRWSNAVEFMSWLLVAAGGFGAILLSGRLDEWLGRQVSAETGPALRLLFGWVLFGAILLYSLVVVLAIPWPLRLHLVLIVAGTLAWLAQQPGRMRSWLGSLWLRFAPETGGRGLWRNSARRRLMRELIRTGDAARLVSGEELLVVSACDLATGRVSYFANRMPEHPGVFEVFDDSLNELVIVRDTREMIEAAIASSAVPVLFVPVKVRGREYMDAGLFANQPVAMVTALGADAVLLVLVSPAAGPRPARPEANLVEIAGRLSEIANWRDLQTELRRLPPKLSRSADPARLCVVEPEGPLEGAMFDFGARDGETFMKRGEQDALRCLAKAGWIEATEAPTEAPIVAPIVAPSQPGDEGARERQRLDTR